ncbi:VRR-NUC domain-containing protein [Motilimonas cestriensis]|uniref:DNA-directed DNA polymerase n=1 Tax=Motilimonas cestriensis TaxID=2742685 RepID=A0ABS8W9E5_9GAMM|nr:exonuclease domain-containing protein [Motilimonas cestriensis]MCE2595634.1 VRR-NUC domain-containing protein [Motilimonas cestriensis]
MKTLPEKYYLAHFYELVAFIDATSLHLLNTEQLRQYALVQRLSEAALCLLIRIINRKSNFVAPARLNYAEILDITAALAELEQHQLITSAAQLPASQLLPELTKAQLQDVCAQAGVVDMPANSAKKQAWIDCALKQSCAIKPTSDPTYQAYVQSVFKDTFDYFLYLYFAHLGGTLAQFSMRDLGILKTNGNSSRAAASQLNAHFDELEEAQSAFHYSQWLHQLKVMSDEEKTALAQALLTPAKVEPVGRYGQEKYNLLSYKLAHHCLTHAPDIAMTLLAQSDHPKAQEKHIRALYAEGELTLCQAKLNAILEASADESLLLFAQDFSRLKFGSQRTSLLTEMLRNSGTAIPLDEAFVGAPEQGLIDYYQRHGITAIHSENGIWRALFCLSFWPELYQSDKNQLSNEFALRPKSIKENNFYDTFAAEVETRLQHFTDAQAMLAWLLQQITAHYGEPNCFMAWYDHLYDQLCLLVRHSPMDALRKHLRAMSKNYRGLKDGYPDLIGVRDGKLFCVEVKAPGDSLRRNQIVTMNQLLSAGFDVSIQQVAWQLDPAQPYVIVDVETTGGQKEYDRITEIALVKVVAGEVVDQWSSLVNPNKHISRQITALTGINNQMVRDAPVFAQLAEKIDAFSQGAIFVAHNVNFDMGMIKAEFARCGLSYRRAKLCTVVLARKWLPGHDSYSLGKLCADVGITLNGHHRALNDANATADLFIMINALRLAHSAQ